MRKSFVRALGVLALILAGGATPIMAQNGSITGRVTDAETGAILANTQILVLGAGDAQAGGILTNAQGEYRLSIAPGTYSLVAQTLGYRQNRVDGVSVNASGATTLDFSLTSTQFELNPVVVTASRRQEKALDSPSNIVTIGAERISERAVTSPAEHVKALAGVDVVQSGLTSANVVTRGFNNVFSGALLVMTDNRYASVPSLRFNAYNMIPTNQFDVERIEVLLGPAAALYGPNSASGVMHIITSSPIDDQSTKASVSVGERSVFQTQFRSAAMLGDNAGIKFSGQYMRGDDWEYTDPVEQAQRQGILDQNGDPGQIGQRNFATERWGGEVRLDIRPWDDGELIFNAGLNNLATSIELTGVGAGQGQDWKYSYAQARINKGRLFGQLFLNQSDAGESFLLRTGQPLEDKSLVIGGQIQHGFSWGERQDFIYGIDISRTEPRTSGTITGRNEDDDIIDEIGGYLHSETALTDKVNFVAAIRVDDHNRLDDLVFSPRAALVFSPKENQTFRLTFNRAFSTPTTNNLFLDLVAGRIPVSPTVGYDVRTLGVPTAGFTFNDQCQGGIQNLCMYSPFDPTGSQLPANAGILWDGLLQGLFASQLPPSLIAALSSPGAAPGDPALGSTLRRFNQEVSSFVPDAGPTAIVAMLPTIYNTFEAGYKGLLGNRLLVSADIYSQRINDFVGPLRTETPTVFFDAASVQAFVLQRLGPAIQGGLVTQAQATQIITTMAKIPVGTVAPDQAPGTDLILTYRNFGDVDLWGADLAFQFLATDRLSFSGSYSYVSQECFDFNTDGSCSSAQDISLNAPTNKGSVGARYEDKISGFTLDGRARYTDGFAMNSGVYIGTVDSYTAVDVNLGYRLPMARSATITFTATNLFNNVHQEFIGAPAIGRLFLTRLSYAF